MVTRFLAARRSRVAALLLFAALASACAPDDPEIVAIEYLRATRTGQSDQAVALLDMDRIVQRVEKEIALVNTGGDPHKFLRDSVSATLWGLFQETPREDGLQYDATPAQIEGDTARVRVTMTYPDATTRSRTVWLRRTSSGWRVSGRSIDDLVSYVIQRLDERY